MNKRQKATTGRTVAVDGSYGRHRQSHDSSHRSEEVLEECDRILHRLCQRSNIQAKREVFRVRRRGNLKVSKASGNCQYTWIVVACLASFQRVHPILRGAVSGISWNRMRTYQCSSTFSSSEQDSSRSASESTFRCQQGLIFVDDSFLNRRRADRRQ